METIHASAPARLSTALPVSNSATPTRPAGWPTTDSASGHHRHRWPN